MMMMSNLIVMVMAIMTMSEFDDDVKFHCNGDDDDMTMAEFEDDNDDVRI